MSARQRESRGGPMSKWCVHRLRGCWRTLLSRHRIASTTSTYRLRGSATFRGWRSNNEGSVLWFVMMWRRRVETRKRRHCSFPFQYSCLFERYYSLQKRSVTPWMRMCPIQFQFSSFPLVLHLLRKGEYFDVFHFSIPFLSGREIGFLFLFPFFSNGGTNQP